MKITRFWCVAAGLTLVAVAAGPANILVDHFDSLSPVASAPRDPGSQVDRRPQRNPRCEVGAARPDDSTEHLRVDSPGSSQDRTPSLGALARANAEPISGGLGEPVGVQKRPQLAAEVAD
jgi:hypothetical protein